MSDNQKIPFLDLVGLHEEIENELVPIFQKTLRTAGFIGGPTSRSSPTLRTASGSRAGPTPFGLP